MNSMARKKKEKCSCVLGKEPVYLNIAIKKQPKYSPKGEWLSKLHITMLWNNIQPLKVTLQKTVYRHEKTFSMY